MVYAPVKGLLKGLKLLETVNALGPMGLSQLARQTGIPKATTLRLLETLLDAGYVEFDRTSATYRVSLRSLALSNKFSPDRYLLDTAAPIMQSLREKLGWPSDLAVFHHDKMVIIDTNRRPGMLSANRTVGSRVPMLASATGRAYLANTAAEERRVIMDRLQHSTDPYEALVRQPAEVERILRETHERGYGISNQELLPSNRGGAVAVMSGSKVACVINLIVVAAIVPIEEVHERYIPLLLEAKRKLEAKLNLESLIDSAQDGWS